MFKVYIGLGSNLGLDCSLDIGSKVASIEAAILKIAKLSNVTILKLSSFYETPPIGKLDQPNFCNAVCAIETNLDAQSLLCELKRIERELGRTPNYEKWGPRMIDLDVLYFANHVLNLGELIIPHPEIQNRKFVMIPLLELDDPVHPIFDVATSMLLHSTSDQSNLIRLYYKMNVELLLNKNLEKKNERSD